MSLNVLLFLFSFMFRNGSRLTDEQKEKIKELKEKGLDVNEIAEALNLYASTVSYHYSPEFRKRTLERSRKYLKDREKPSNKEFEMVIDVFTSLDMKLSVEQVWEKVGGRYGRISKRLKGYHVAGILKEERVGNNVVYSLNPESPCICVVDGAFKEKEKELDRLMRR